MCNDNTACRTKPWPSKSVLCQSFRLTSWLLQNHSEESLDSYPKIDNQYPGGIGLSSLLNLINLQSSCSWPSIWPIYLNYAFQDYFYGVHDFYDLENLWWIPNAPFDVCMSTFIFRCSFTPNSFHCYHE